MSKRVYLLSGLLLLPFLTIGCAQKKCTSDFCQEPVVTEIQYQDLVVNECPKQVKSVILKNPCGNCGDYAVSVRASSCCNASNCP